MRVLKVAILGFGNSGKALAKIILQKQKEIKEKMKWEIKVVAIATARRGNLVYEKGIDLEKVLKDLEKNECFDRECDSYSHWSSHEIIEKVDYDVLIEITPLNIFSGQPATDHIRLALSRRRNVITANKGPIAWAFRELRDLAERQGVNFFYETTVMDGTPVFNLMDETLPMCKVKEINGILNTTTNFILDEIGKGRSFDDAIIEGKRRGFVEADPSMDIEGWDAAAKTAALINVLMDGNITPLGIKRKGIQDITCEDIMNAKREDKVIKLVCHGIVCSGEVIGEVKPLLLEKDHIFARIAGTSSILSLNTDLMGEITIVEHNPEIEQTGYGLFSDLLRLIKRL